MHHAASDHLAVTSVTVLHCRLAMITSLVLSSLCSLLNAGFPISYPYVTCDVCTKPRAPPLVPRSDDQPADVAAAHAAPCARPGRTLARVRGGPVSPPAATRRGAVWDPILSCVQSISLCTDHDALTDEFGWCNGMQPLAGTLLLDFGRLAASAVL